MINKSNKNVNFSDEEIIIVSDDEDNNKDDNILNDINKEIIINKPEYKIF